MYCPKCGQQQISDEMRFCSRCGLALTELAEWLAGGSLPVKPADEEPNVTMSQRRKNMRRAAKLMFFSVVLFPIFLVIAGVADDPAPAIPPLVLFFISLAWMLYARLFMEKTERIIDRSVQTSTLGAPPYRAPLPPATTPPISNIGRQHVRTNELAQPPSVTDHTTKLLDQDEHSVQ
jgi:endogenous inhibitor of DNA gyrase (YacG/DUF329 family)